MVNALQRRADVVVQKSLAEGFGLTVAEAMWKGAAGRRQPASAASRTRSSTRSRGCSSTRATSPPSAHAVCRLLTDRELAAPARRGRARARARALPRAAPPAPVGRPDRAAPRPAGRYRLKGSARPAGRYRLKRKLNACELVPFGAERT